MRQAQKAAGPQPHLPGQMVAQARLAQGRLVQARLAQKRFEQLAGPKVDLHVALFVVLAGLFAEQRQARLAQKPEAKPGFDLEREAAPGPASEQEFALAFERAPGLEFGFEPE